MSGQRSIKIWLNSRGVISDTGSGWRFVTSSVLQGSILGPVFNLFINGLNERADASSTNSLMTQSWEEQTIPECCEIFRKTLIGWKDGQGRTV